VLFSGVGTRADRSFCIKAETPRLYITAPKRPDRYLLEQFVFHWAMPFRIFHK